LAGRYRVEQVAGKYLIDWPLASGEAVTAHVDRVKQHKDGRVTARVKITAHLLNNRQMQLHQGQLNLVAVRSRRELANALASRLDREDINWDAIVEDMCREVTEREEQTAEAKQLGLVPASDPKFLVWPVILERLPVLWYGPGASGKTMIALYFALLVQNGLLFMDKPIAGKNVLYCDWEVDMEEAERRASFLARHLEEKTKQKIKLPFYRRCILPLVEEASDIAGDVIKNDIGLIIIDSAGPACGGDIQSAELAVQFFNALRKIYAPVNAATIILTHVTKGERRDGKQHRLPIGSIYFENLPRATWELRPQETVSDNEISIGIFCRKTNLFQKPHPFGLKLQFNEDKIAISVTQAEDIVTEEKALEETFCEIMSKGPVSAKELAEETGTTVNSVWVILNRLKKRGKVLNIARGKWALVAHNVVPFPSKETSEDDKIPF